MGRSGVQGQHLHFRPQFRPLDHQAGRGRTGRLLRPSAEGVRQAREHIAGLALRTPLLKIDPARLPGAAGRGLLGLKLESLQQTGSFKLRGAINALLALSDDEKQRGVVTASSGNHGSAVAWAGATLGVGVTVFVPRWTDPVKVARMQGAGATVEFVESGYDGAEAGAAMAAEQHGLTLVHPFDAPLIIEGQGTVALEILDDMPAVEEVLVPLSGGGLAAGIAVALSDSPVRVVCVSAERASVMHQSLAAGRPIQVPDEDTVASALSGGIGLHNRHTFALVRELADEHVVVSESAVRRAMATAFRNLKLVVEGGGAVSIAALLEGYQPRGPAALVLSGGNVDPQVLLDVLGDVTPP